MNFHLVDGLEMEFTAYNAYNFLNNRVLSSFSILTHFTWNVRNVYLSEHDTD